MRRHTTLTISGFSCAVAMTATSVLALPTDMGRSADVYSNAIRYFAAQSAPTPQMRPAHFASLTANAGEDLTAQDVAAATTSDNPFEDAAFSVPLQARDLATVNFAGAMEDEVFKLALKPHDPATINIAGAMEDIAFAEPLEPRDLATLNIPRASYDDVFAVSLVAVEVPSLKAPTTPDDVFAVPLEPRSLASLNVPDVLKTPTFLAALDAAAQAPEADVIQATLSRAPLGVSAGSSRLGVPSDSDATLVAGVGAATQDLTDSFMDEMAAADSNFTIREGAGDRPDTMMMSSDVLFAFGKAALATEAEDTLKTMTTMFANVTKVEVFGHTDAIGNESANLALGQRRAEVVRDWLLENSDLSPEQIIATGVGETDPVALNLDANGNDNPEGRAQNRRVEFAFW